MADKNTKEKKIKIPALFKKPIKEKAFEKNFIKKLYIDRDKEFLKNIVIKNEQGDFVLKEKLTEEESKKLDTLAKSIKKNRAGAIDTFKVALLLIIIGCVAAFNILFKDMLVKKAMETGLESIFNAKAEVTGVKFEILGGKIGFGHLSVADESSPMKNLFELGKTEILIDMQQVFRGKFVSKDLECQAIEWNTDRKTSGALQKKAAAATGTKNGAKKAEEKPFIDISKINVNQIIESNKNNLKSLAQISNAGADVTAMNTKWTNKIQDSRAKINSTSKSVEDVKKIDVNSIKTVEQAQSALQKVNAAYPAVNGVVSDAGQLSKDFDADKKKAETEIADSKKSVDGDVSYVTGLIQLPKGGAQSIVSSIANDFLKAKFGSLYNYVRKAQNYLYVIKGTSDTNAKKIPPQEPKRRGGYNVPFPETVYPKFLMQNLAASAGTKNAPYFLSASIKDISSDPDLWNKATVFALNQVNKGQEIIVNGSADGRKTAQDKFSVHLEFNNQPFNIKEGLGFLQAKSFTGDYRFNTDFKLDKNDESAGLAVIGLSGIKIDLVNPDDLISKTVAETLQESKEVTIEIDYKIKKDGSVALNAKSNIDKKISDKIGGIINNLSKKYEGEIKTALMKMAEDELKKNETVYSAFKKTDELSKGNLKDANALKAEVDKKKKDLDDKINQITKEAQDKVTNEAAKKAKDAAKSLPKIPGF